MENWDDLKILVAIQKFGSMSAAARELGTNVATISRRMSRLGQELGLSPLVKLKGKWVLNPALQDILEHSADFQSGLANLLASLAKDTDAQHTLTTRIGAPSFMNGILFANAYRRFRKSNPDHTLEFQGRSTTDALGDCDIMITDIMPEQGRLMIRRLGECGFNIYRYSDSPKGDGWVGLTKSFDSSEPFKTATQLMGQPPTVRTSTYADALLFASSSRLPVFLPELVAQGDADLRPVDPTAQLLGSFWLAYHDSRKDDAALAIVIQWIVDTFHAMCVGN